MCPGTDQARWAQELRVRGGPASWGSEERLRWRGLELGVEDEAQDRLGQAKKRKRAFHVGTEDEQTPAGSIAEDASREQ